MDKVNTHSFVHNADIVRIRYYVISDLSISIISKRESEIIVVFNAFIAEN